MERYKLIEGKPIRIGFLGGKKVQLVRVEPNPDDRNNPHCCQCVFFKRCIDFDLRDPKLPSTCLDVPKGVYKEVK